MDETVKRELLDKTKHALVSGDWATVTHIWQPWVDQDDLDAKFQVAYHYLWHTSRDDDSTAARMQAWIRDAAAREHPDAMWFMAAHLEPETNTEFERLLMRAGQLGSARAQRMLGVMYATGDWTGPTDLAQAAHWYRRAAEQGEAESQYDLGFMLLLGQGQPKDVAEALIWLERAGEQGEYVAFRLLVDCYENGYCGVPVDPARAAVWRERMEEWQRLNPPKPSVRYVIEGGASESALSALSGIEGIDGWSSASFSNHVEVFFDPAVIAPADVTARIREIFPAVPVGEQGE